jgi:hypothetical protein
MKKIALALLISAFAIGSAAAQSCSTKAMGKDGKALAGAAKASFMKKCCEDSAMSADGMKLAGGANTSYVNNCESGG